MALSESPTLDEIVNEIERLNNLIIDRGGEQIITPNTTDQVLEKGNYKSDITVLGDTNLISNNIAFGKTIFNVIGNCPYGIKTAGSDNTLYYHRGVTSTNTGSYILHLFSVTVDERILELESVRLSCTVRYGSTNVSKVRGFLKKKDGTSITLFDFWYSRDNHVNLTFTKDFYTRPHGEDVYLEPGDVFYFDGCYTPSVTKFSLGWKYTVIDK